MNEFDVNKNILGGFQTGANSIKALEPSNIIQNIECGPYVFQAKLGQCIVRVKNEVNAREMCCKEDCIKFLQQRLAKVDRTKSTKEPSAAQCCYLPHHGFYQPNEPDQIRVGFD